MIIRHDIDFWNYSIVYIYSEIMIFLILFK